MNQGRSIFAQLLDFAPSHLFQRCVERYQGNKWVQSFSCWDQFICMAFAQLTSRQSLREIAVCLGTQQSKLYHVGLRGKVSKSTLSDANNHRDWRIYSDFARVLIDIARPLYAGEELGIDLQNSVYALDSTIIDLCLSLFPWAHFVPTKAGVKMHTLLDLRGSIPVNVHVTAANLHDVNMLERFTFESGSIIVLDRGYLDFERLYRLQQQAVFFVIRGKRNLRFRRVYSHGVIDPLGLVQCDQTIALTNPSTLESYPAHLRRIKVKDVEKGGYLVFLTNNFLLDAGVIAELYRQRWKIETFFKWIKGHLRIKSFYSYSENAVKTQIWIALSAYLMVAIAHKQLNVPFSFYRMLQIISVCLFDKVPLLQLLSEINYKSAYLDNSNQLCLQV